MGNTSRQPKPVPSSIALEVAAVDIAAHPKEDLLAVANLDGELLLYRFSCEEDNELVHTVDVHKKACRVAQFTDDGSGVYTACKSGQVILTDTETQRQKHKCNHHKCPIYCLVNINSNVIATGDDDGNIKLCDLRQKSAVATWETMDDYIAALVTNEDRKTLVAASGGGVISSYSIPNRKPLFESSEYNFEPTSMAVMNRGARVAVSTSGKRNPILMFKWGEFGAYSDKFTGHPDGITCMQKVSETIMVTGSETGIIRALTVTADATNFLGIIGQHDESLVAESLTLSCDKSTVISYGQDQAVRFWNIEFLENMYVPVFSSKKRLNRNLQSSRYQDARQFYNDIRTRQEDT